MSLSDWASFFSILSSLENLTSINQWMLAIISGSLVTVIGVFLGTVLTYLVQKRTQMRAWKKEHYEKVSETVYGPLYQQVENMISDLKKKSFPEVHFDWEQIRKTYKRLWIPKDFRDKLDGFLKRVSGYNDTIDEFHKTLLRIVKEEAESILNIDIGTHGFRPNLKYTKKDGTTPSCTGGEIVENLLKNEHPMESLLRVVNESEIKNPELNIQIGTETVIPVDIDIFNQFWKSCVDRRKKPYQSILRKKRVILKDAKNLKDKLEERIQQPWNI